MAEIVQSLFGVTPQAYQQAQQDRIDAQALQFAKLDPFQQANYAIGRGASGLAGAIGGALGGQDPELQRVTMRQQIAGQINPNDPASIEKGIVALQQGGDAEGAFMLQSEYRKMQESGALVDQRRAAEAASRAQANREREPRAAPTTNELTNARAIAAAEGPEGSPEYNAAFKAEYARLTAPKDGQEGSTAIQQLLRTGKFTPASVAAYQTSGEIGDLKPMDSELQTQVVETAQGQILINKKTGDTIVNLGAAPDRRTVNKINVGGTAENEYAKKVGSSTATADLNIIDNAQSVAGTLPKMYETRQLIETGALNTGFAAELQQVVDRAKTKILSDKAAGKRVTDTEYLDALLGSDVFPQISALGIGARGLDTPAEREFLRQVITGTISLDRATLKRMTDFRIKSAERAVEGYNKKLTAGELNQYQKITGRTLNPIAVTPRPVSGQGDGTAGNPIKLR